MLVDLDFDLSGNLIVGLRDRTGDMRLIATGVTEPTAGDKPAYALGDLLRARVSDGAFGLQTDFYHDGLTRFPHSTTGGLASLISADVVAAGGLGAPRVGKLGRAVGWYDNRTGLRIATEIVQPYVTDWIPGSAGVACKVPFGAPSVGDVELLCGVAGTPTVTAQATATASATPHRPASPTPSPTSTSTPTQRSHVPLYLPILLREECVPGQERIDVALVVDASTTMQDDFTSAGRTKLDAAIEAAHAFVATMALPQDKAAVVAFNSDAKVVQGLTGERLAIDLALARLPQYVRQQTRIDRGIEEAHSELISVRRGPVNRAVMILLTDGLANPEPASTAVRRAQAAKDDHITIFAIGLGHDAELNVPELRQIASQPDYFYRAPDGEDLLSIYRTIAVEIPCPADAFWGRR
jgi:Mg-chelatase subunit ChlD